jgi:hypothetical protein
VSSRSFGLTGETATTGRPVMSAGIETSGVPAGGRAASA